MPGDGEHPGKEREGRVVRVPVAVDGEQRLLRDVLGPVGLVKPLSGEFPHQHQHLREQGLVRVTVPLLGPGHQVREMSIGAHLA